MGLFAENLRLILIRWNVAPLSLVVVLVWALIDITQFYKNSACDMPEWHVAAIFAYMGAIAGLIFKMYGSLQKNRGADDEDK